MPRGDEASEPSQESPPRWPSWLNPLDVTRENTRRSGRVLSVARTLPTGRKCWGTRLAAPSLEGTPQEPRAAPGRGIPLPPGAPAPRLTLPQRGDAFVGPAPPLRLASPRSPVPPLLPALSPPVAPSHHQGWAISWDEASPRARPPTWTGEAVSGRPHGPDTSSTRCPQRILGRLPPVGSEVSVQGGHLPPRPRRPSLDSATGCRPRCQRADWQRGQAAVGQVEPPCPV